MRFYKIFVLHLLTEDLKLDELQKFDVIEERAVRIIGERTGSFLVQNEECIQCLSLSEDDQIVEDFRELQEEKEVNDCLPLMTKDELRQW